MVVHYEDFQNNFEGTVTNMHSFLNLKTEANPVPFLNSFYKLSYFDTNDRMKMSTFMKNIALEDSLKHMEGYLVYQKEDHAAAAAKHNGLVFYNVKANGKKDDAPSSNSSRDKLEYRKYQRQTYSNNSNKPKEYTLTFYNVRKRNKVKTIFRISSVKIPAMVGDFSISFHRICGHFIIQKCPVS